MEKLEQQLNSLEKLAVSYAEMEEVLGKITREMDDELEKAFGQVREVQNVCACKSSSSAVTYSEALKKSAAQSRDHDVLVFQPSDSGAKPSQSGGPNNPEMSQFAKALSKVLPSNGKAKDMQPGRNRSVLVSFATVSDRDQAEQQIKSQEPEFSCAVGQSKARKPALIVRPDPTTVEKEQFAKTAREQNGIQEYDFEVVRKFGHSRGAFYFYVVKVLYDVRDNFLKTGRLLVQYVSCPVEVYVNLVPCFCCLKFGHKAFDCKSHKNPNCRYCAGNHKSETSELDQHGTFKCNNFVSENLLDRNNPHSASALRSCPVARGLKELIVSRIPNNSKNQERVRNLQPAP